MTTRAIFFSLVLALACGGGTDTAAGGDESAGGTDVATGSVAAAIAGSHRSEANRARDQYRHPAETLAFFGLEPTMTVVEMAPGGGWYTEILAPALKGQGKLIAAIPDPEESPYGERFMTFLQG